MKLSYLILGILLAFGCESESELKTAIRIQTQSETDFEIVSVDTVFVSDMFKDAATRMIESANDRRDRLNRIRILKASVGMNYDFKEDSLVNAYMDQARLSQCFADEYAGKVVGYKVKTTIGNFFADSAISKIKPDFSNPNL
jgi:hypothetical protein